jgi:hypothetical protein
VLKLLSLPRTAAYRLSAPPTAEPLVVIEGRLTLRYAPIASHLSAQRLTTRCTSTSQAGTIDIKLDALVRRFLVIYTVFERDKTPPLIEPNSQHAERGELSLPLMRAKLGDIVATLRV